MTAFLASGSAPGAANVRSAGECTCFVSTYGNDANDGRTALTPWRTIQHAANIARPGDVVCMRGGVYEERVVINISGNDNQYITLQSYSNEQAVLDGGNLEVPATSNGMIYIRNHAYLIVKGLEIRNYKTATKGHVPNGILVTGTSHHIELRNNRIHHIEHNGTFRKGTNAHGIAVYGTSGIIPADNIIIDGNEIYHLKLGSSEALVINGNVQNWYVTNNRIHDVDNIGIDAIGFEGKAPDNDQARDGLIAGNHVYNIDSFDNPAYGTVRSAGCIYVDGGTRVTIERNWVINCNLGIELASEHAGKATSFVTVQNNFIYGNTEVGLSLGGYSTGRGAVRDCLIINNKFFNNNRSNDWGAEILFQYDVSRIIIKNNIIFANDAGWYIRSWSRTVSGNTLEDNLFISTPETIGRWEWKGTTYSSFSAYRFETGNDNHSKEWKAKVNGK